MGRQQVDGYERRRKRIELTLPDLTLRQLEDLAERMDTSRSQVVEAAVERLWEELAEPPAAAPT